MSTREALLDYAWTLDGIDTHEHTPGPAKWVQADHDVLCEWLTHYFCDDLVSAGLTERQLNEVVRDGSRPLAERWRLVEPYWDAARHTGYGVALDLAARGLYGLEAVRADTIEELDRRFRAARRKTASGEANHYDFVLKQKSRVAVSIVDSNPDCDKRYFVSACRLDHYLQPGSPDDVRAVGEKAGVAVRSLDDWLAAAEAELDAALAKGVVAVKTSTAYWRSLRYPKVQRRRAEEAFRSIAGVVAADPADEGRARETLQDFVMHHVLGLADRRGLPVQVHTGLQAGTGNDIANANPELMTDLFRQYPNVTFDIFHMGYPYQQTLSAIAKTFRNVMIDMSWAHVISPEACVRAVVEWLDAVPANKISAFGGDYLFVDGVYGGACLARRNIARSLACKVDQGSFDLDRAKEICRWFFVDNPKRIFRL